LLAAVDMLVDAANKADHKDSLMFHKSLAMYRKQILWFGSETLRVSGGQKNIVFGRGLGKVQKVR